MANTNEINFTQLLDEAVNKPGIISAAYNAFHGYSIGNQLLAMMQCSLRGITPGPIATFNGWKKKDRFVMKGQKAIVLCMPVTHKIKATNEDEQDSAFTRFVYRPNWFVLKQTDGAEYVPTPVINDWDASRALAALDIKTEEFSHTDGNTQGYAKARTIAVSPLCAMPDKTRFHEIAHILLGHTTEHEMNDNEQTPRNIREVEAEATAMICLEILNLPGADYCRGYIQAWNGGNTPITEKSAQKIFKTANQIIAAGKLKPESQEA